MKIAIIILNWNGAENTIKCVESLLSHVAGPERSIIIVDNFSCDNSIEIFLKKWHMKTIPNRKFSFSEIENHICILKSPGNLGYAGGNNYAINILKSSECDFDYVWILNNDTILKSDALLPLEVKMQNDPQLGFVGSVIADIEKNNIQCFGGIKGYSPIGIFWKVGKNRLLNNIPEKLNFKYLTGASMLISSRVIENVGVMDESYFLYFEEADWQLAAAKKGFQIGVSPNSIVFHGESATVGPKSKFFYFMYCRASVMFVRKNYSKILSIVPLLLLPALVLLKTRRISLVAAALSGATYGFNKDYFDFSGNYFKLVSAKSIKS